MGKTETRGEAVKSVYWVSGQRRMAVVMRHIAAASPGRVRWSVIFAGLGIATVDTAVSGLRTFGEAARIAEAFCAGVTA
jgi:hypothetical protein